MTWKPKQIYKGQNDLDTDVIITESMDDNNGKTLTFHYPWMDEQELQQAQDNENSFLEGMKYGAKKAVKAVSDVIDTVINKPIGAVISAANDVTGGVIYDALGNEYVQKGMSVLTPSKWIGMIREGYAPWDPRNTGTGSYETDNVFDTTIAFLPFGGISKFKGTKFIDIKPENYYRVGRDLYKDAKESGVIKSRQLGRDQGDQYIPFFNKGQFFWEPSIGYDIIEGTNNIPKVKWRKIDNDGNIIDSDAAIRETSIANINSEIKQLRNLSDPNYKFKTAKHPEGMSLNELKEKYKSTDLSDDITRDNLKLEIEHRKKLMENSKKQLNDIENNYNILLDNDINYRKAQNKDRYSNDSWEGRQYAPEYNNRLDQAPSNEFAFYKVIRNPLTRRDEYINYGLLDNLKYGGAGATTVGLMGIGSNLPQYKKGSKIHIKKANRGKFTDYCGGTVTNECIQRGKNSSDPKIRKRATFAANARKWKKG